MKITIDIHDALLERIRRHARRTGRSLRDMVEEGLRRVLAERTPEPYALPDASVGDPGADDPLEALSQQELMDEVYSRPRSR